MDVITHIWLATGWLTFVLVLSTRAILVYLQAMVVAADHADRVTREQIVTSQQEV